LSLLDIIIILFTSFSFHGVK